MRSATLLMLLLCGCYPALKTPRQLAYWSRCNPCEVADWIGSMTEYRRQQGYLPASDVMARQWGDCKGRAQIALETLQACNYKTHIVLLSSPDKPADHVITVFTIPDGRRGFINSSQCNIYPAEISWSRIIKDVDDGKWQAVFAEEHKENTK